MLDDFDPGPDAFVDTAAAMKCLDLVVSVDTSVAHLAGALGVPAIVLLKRLGADWRWLYDREDTVWYPLMRLYRQAAPGEWTPLLHKVAIELDTGLKRL